MDNVDKYELIHSALTAAVQDAMDFVAEEDPEARKSYAIFDLAFSELFKDWTDYDVFERIAENQEFYESRGEDIDAIIEELYNPK